MGDGSNVREVQYAYRTSDATLANDNSLNDDSQLLLPIKANEKVIFEYNMIWVSLAGGIRCSINGPAGYVNLRYTGMLNVIAAAINILGGSAWNAGGLGANGPSSGNAIFCGMVENGATAGNIVASWAQQVSDANNTTVYRGSYIRTIRLI